MNDTLDKLQQLTQSVLLSSLGTITNDSPYGNTLSNFEDVVVNNFYHNKHQINTIVAQVVDNVYKSVANGGCPNCYDGTYVIKKGDNFWKLEEDWNMPHGKLSDFNPGMGTLHVGDTITVSPRTFREFKAGIGNPTLTHDAGFSNFPKENPTFEDIKSYKYWQLKAAGARVLRSDLDDALDAYDRYLEASGDDLHFDLDEYFAEDESGRLLKENVIKAAKEASENLLPHQGVRNISMSTPFYVSSSSIDYPYPATENWQKAIGAFPFYISGTITALDTPTKIEYSLDFTIYAEDMYNFNPSQKDIKTGIPDDVNGRFEVVGFAKQFLSKGSYSTTINWSVVK